MYRQMCREAERALVFRLMFGCYNNGISFTQHLVRCYNTFLYPKEINQLIKQHPSRRKAKAILRISHWIKKMEYVEMRRANPIIPLPLP